MKLTELWEQDKGELLRRLQGADAARGGELLQREAERMLFACNDDCGEQRERDEAAALTRALCAALPLIDTAGEVRVWERETPRHGRLPTLALVLLALGSLCCVAAGVWALTRDAARWLPAALPLLGGALLFVAAWSGRREQGRPERRTEVAVDWEKVCRVLGTAFQVLDQSLEDSRSRTYWEQRRQAQAQPVLTGEELELYERLLEGLYSADGAYALEQLGQLRHYLRGRGVLLEDYSEEKAALFDCMPGQETATLRPALTTAAGTVLSRGLTVRSR